MAAIFHAIGAIQKKNKLEGRGMLRTIKNIVQNYASWREAGAVKNEEKKFKNCIHPPISTGSPRMSALEIISLPEFHLMLGVVNHIYSHMPDELNKEAIILAYTCHVQRDLKRGSPAFNGNLCKKLFSKIDELHTNCSTPPSRC